MHRTEENHTHVGYDAESRRKRGPAAATVGSVSVDGPDGRGGAPQGARRGRGNRSGVRGEGGRPGSRGALEDRRGRVLHGAGVAGPGHSRGGPAVRGDWGRRGPGGALQGQGGAIRRLARRARTCGSIRSSESSVSRSTTSQPSSTSMRGCPARSTRAAPIASCCSRTRAGTTWAGWRRTSASRPFATSSGASWQARRSAPSASASSIRTGTRPAP